jgi:hypothetical protein
MRTIIVHYHILKNAGSTVDRILEQTFAEKWITYDTSDPAGRITPHELASYISQHPEIEAVSSHQAMPQFPVRDGLRILPIIFLRHPLDRARSVYDFERRQGQELGPISKGAEHAARLTFPDYLRWRFQGSENGVVHNYQTAWLCSFLRNVFRRKIRHADFVTAQGSVEALPAFGIVERFEESVSWFEGIFSAWAIELDVRYSPTNVSPSREATLEGRLERTKEELGEAMWNQLLERNAWDIRLYEFAQRLFSERHGEFSASLDKGVVSISRARAAG